MSAIVSQIAAVRDHGENLTIVTVRVPNQSPVEGILADGFQEFEVVANKREDGSPRWQADEVCVYVSEGSIIPEGVLKARGYWDHERNKGLLEGKKGNRVKMRRFAGFESRGLLFKVDQLKDKGEIIGLAVSLTSPHPTDPDSITMDALQEVKIGDDVSEFFGITEHVAG